MKERISTEIELRQAKELECRELEVAHHNLAVSQQQKKNELAEVNDHLQGEYDYRIFQERLFKEQTKMCELLRAESIEAQDFKNELISKLEISESSRKGGWLF